MGYHAELSLEPQPTPAGAGGLGTSGVVFALLALSVAAAAVVAHVYGVVDLPRGFYVDESSIAYNAHLISQVGRDEHGVPWPLYFEAFGEYKNPLYIYLLALVYRVAGYSELTTRLLSAVCWALGSGLTYLLGRRLFPDAASRLYLLVCLGFTPWLFSLSRISFEIIVLFPVLAFFLLSTYRAYEEGSARWALASGVAIGVSFYAYSTFRLLAPLHAIAVLLCFAHRRHARLHLCLLAGAAAASLPYLVYTISHLENLTRRFDRLTYLHRDDLTVLHKLGMFAERYLGYFTPEFLATAGDPNRRHHTGFGGELLLPTSALLALGVAVLVAGGEARRSPFVRLLLLGLLSAPIAAALTTDTHHSLRAFSMVVFAILLSAHGVRYLAKWRFAGPMVALTTANAALYTFDYFHAYPAVSALAFENHGFREALLEARSLAHGKIVVSDEGNQPRINVLFFDSVLPDPRRVPVAVGHREDLEEGDVLILPARSGRASWSIEASTQ